MVFTALRQQNSPAVKSILISYYPPFLQGMTGLAQGQHKAPVCEDTGQPFFFFVNFRFFSFASCIFKGTAQAGPCAQGRKCKWKAPSAAAVTSFRAAFSKQVLTYLL